jgi:hypothetical protein
MISESDIERRLRDRLHEYGFRVLKLYTPGNSGTMDRMILMPKYCPGPPKFVEIKRPGKKLRELQLAVAEDWRKRGCDIMEPCCSILDVERLCHKLIEAVKNAPFA